MRNNEVFFQPLAITWAPISFLKSMLLHQRKCEENISQHIKKWLQSIAAEWGLDPANKTISIVADNAYCMLAAVAKTGWNNYPCLAHKH